MIDDLVSQTVEEILSGFRQDALRLPIQAERAARQVLSRHDVGSSVFVGKLLEEAIAFEAGYQIIGDWQKFVRISLVDFIGEAAKQRMGDQYPRLLHERLEKLSPTRAG